MRLALWLASAAFALLTPVLLIATNASLTLTSHTLYEYSLDRYDAVGRTGLPRQELLKGTRGIIAYFNDDAEDLEIVVVVEGLDVPLFNQGEVLHMRDVKALVQGVRQAQLVTLGLALGYVVFALLAVASGRTWARAYLARAFLAGGVGTAALVLLMGGVAALGGFQLLFLQFHYLSFANLLWVLDPARDRLIQMFPESFFLDATLLIVGATLLQALLLALGGLMLERRNRRLLSGSRVRPAERSPTSSK